MVKPGCIQHNPLFVFCSLDNSLSRRRHPIDGLDLQKYTSLGVAREALPDSVARLLQGLQHIDETAVVREVVAHVLGKLVDGVDGIDNLFLGQVAGVKLAHPILNLLFNTFLIR